MQRKYFILIGLLLVISSCTSNPESNKNAVLLESKSGYSIDCTDDSSCWDYMLISEVLSSDIYDQETKQVYQGFKDSVVCINTKCHIILSNDDSKDYTSTLVFEPDKKLSCNEVKTCYKRFSYSGFDLTKDSSIIENDNDRNYFEKIQGGIKCINNLCSFRKDIYLDYLGVISPPLQKKATE
ncbi:MAG: hypothetical protein JW870_05940 [Candidatus Delongbacteria bacterium]|nr:hypothetical protein [Candidatus Delongbacteria bacterium]